MSLAAALLAGPALAASRTCAGPDFARRADAAIADFVEAQAFSGAVLVARDGRVEFQRGVGLADREWNAPNAPDTKFRLGSITKQFTAAAILQLAEAGKLRLDDPISRFYRDAPASWSKVTLRRLLTHTSGIPSYTSPQFMNGPQRLPRRPEEIIGLTRDAPLEFEPGSKFIYDNTGYILLGYVIEKASGQSYADYLQNHVFGPLGMRDSGYDVTAKVLPKRASGYDLGPNGWVNADYIDMSLPYAAGALYSTTGDLWTWEQALFGGRVVSAASVQLMTTDAGFGYGLGLFVGGLGPRAWIYHHGRIQGFSSSLQRFPDDGVTVIALANLETAPADFLATRLAMLCLGEPGPREVKLSAAALDRYAGDYRSGPLTIRVTREGDHLLTTAPGEIPVRLYATPNGDFVARIRAGAVTFDGGADGKAAALVLHAGGPDLRLPRLAEPAR